MIAMREKYYEINTNGWTHISNHATLYLAQKGGYDYLMKHPKSKACINIRKIVPETGKNELVGSMYWAKVDGRRRIVGQALTPEEWLIGSDGSSVRPLRKVFVYKDGLIQNAKFFTK